MMKLKLEKYMDFIDAEACIGIKDQGWRIKLGDKTLALFSSFASAQLTLNKSKVRLAQ